MNRLSLAAALSVFGLLALAACSSGSATEDDGTLGDDQEVKSEGKMCGGIAGLRCKAGLNCRITAKHPDASGTCVKPKAGEAGALCGGTTGLQCDPGLVCKIASSSSSGPPPGAMGLPKPPATNNGPPPGAMGLPAPQSGTCQASSGPPPGAVGLPQPQPHS